MEFASAHFVEIQLRYKAHFMAILFYAYVIAKRFVTSSKKNNLITVSLPKFFLKPPSISGVLLAEAEIIPV